MRLLMLFAAGFYGLLAAGGLIWNYLRTGRGLPTSLMGGEVWQSLGLGVALAIVVLLVTGPLMSRQSAMRWLAFEIRALIGPVNAGTALILALMSGGAEELFFRGAMQPVLGLTLTSVAFGLLHIGPDRRFLAWTAFAIILGFLFGGIVVITGNLLGPMVGHILVNAVNLRRIGRLTLRPPEAPDAIGTANAFEPPEP
jgi:CAAX protease family protein